jgi:hypothetical protein
MADTWGGGRDIGANVGSKDFGPSGKTGGSYSSGSDEDADVGLQQVEDRIEQAQKMGVNVFGDTFINSLAADMLGGSIKGFGPTYNLGGGNQEADSFLQKYATQYQDVDGQYYYNRPSTFVNRMLTKYGSGSPRNTLMENIYNQLVPGGATPLGILANVPSLMQNVPSPVSTAISLGNMLAGKLGIGVEGDDESEDSEENEGPGYTIDAQGNYNYDSPKAFIDKMLGKFK